MTKKDEKAKESFLTSRNNAVSQDATSEWYKDVRPIRLSEGEVRIEIGIHRKQQ